MDGIFLVIKYRVGLTTLSYELRLILGASEVELQIVDLSLCTMRGGLSRPPLLILGVLFRSHLLSLDAILIVLAYQIKIIVN